MDKTLVNNPPPQWYHVTNRSPAPRATRWPAWDVILSLWLSGEGGHQAVSTPRLWPLCASWGGGEATWRQGRPSCSRSALAGARGSVDMDMQAPPVAVLC